MVERILSYYLNENLGVRSKLYQIFMNGALSGTGRLLIYAVDQGFEHGPIQSFFEKKEAMDPTYHMRFAIESGASAYAAPLGWLEGADISLIGQIPLILKLNSSTRLLPENAAADQAITASVADALRLGCAGIGFTLYPGSSCFLSQCEELRPIIQEAKAKGLLVVVWSYARGESITPKGETSIDIVSYGAHMAALMGAHIIKVKVPAPHIEKAECTDILSGTDLTSLTNRIRTVVDSCFNGKRIVIFSGGASQTRESLLAEAQAIHEGNGGGSIIGRNFFKRSWGDALNLSQEIIRLYQSKSV